MDVFGGSEKKNIQTFQRAVIFVLCVIAPSECHTNQCLALTHAVPTY